MGRPKERRLTDKNLKVLLLVAEGYTDPEIGVELDMTREAVAGHVKTIIDKLDALNRTNAAVKAIRQGVIE